MSGSASKTRTLRSDSKSEEVNKPKGDLRNLMTAGDRTADPGGRSFAVSKSTVVGEQDGSGNQADVDYDPHDQNGDHLLEEATKQTTKRT